MKNNKHFTNDKKRNTLRRLTRRLSSLLNPPCYVFAYETLKGLALSRFWFVSLRSVPLLLLRGRYGNDDTFTT